MPSGPACMRHQPFTHLAPPEKEEVQYSTETEKCSTVPYTTVNLSTAEAVQHSTVQVHKSLTGRGTRLALTAADDDGGPALSTGSQGPEDEALGHTAVAGVRSALPPEVGAGQTRATCQGAVECTEGTEGTKVWHGSLAKPTT